MNKQPKQDTLNRRKAFKYKKKGTSEKLKSKNEFIHFEQGYKDSNLEMTESESVALPFGDSPKSVLFFNSTCYSTKLFLKMQDIFSENDIFL